MRIAVFTDTYLPQINGVTNTLSRLLRYFEAKDIEYKLFIPKYELAPEDQNIENFYSIKMLLYPENRLAFPNSFRISSVLSDFRPDIIHIMTEFNMGLAGLNYGKKHGIPMVSNYTTNFSQYTDYYKLNFLKNSVWSYLRWFHTQNGITLCPSKVAQQELYENGICNTQILSRGIDCGSFHPGLRREELREDLGISGKVAFLYVGRVSCEKDLDILCRSYHEVRRKYREQVALVITGDGPYLEKCKQTFPEDTIFTGYLRGSELAKMYASCDIFVCPSSTETFGNVILEAMASGTPVIGADAGGVGEILTHGWNGLKFSKRNSEELTMAMSRLVEDIDLRDYLKENALEYTAKKSWKMIFDGLLDIYEEILNQKRMSSVSLKVSGYD